MSERTPSTDRIERRTVLSAVAVGLGGVGLSRHALALESSDATYVVRQGDRCVPITPLSGDETVEEFYDYRTPNTDPSGPAYSSYGTTDLQRPEMSICFLYDGPEGLSLVVVHDELDDGTNGGSVTFRLDGLAGGEWLVGDDIYDGESNYDRFRETDDGWRVDWTWTEGRSDGGAYGHLADDFAVTVSPAFNEDAALYGDPYEGEIAEWQFLSGDRDDPDRVSLSLSDPITIRPGGCGGSTTTTTTRETTETERETTEDEATDEETERDEGDEPPAEPLRSDVEIVPGRVNPKSRGRLPVVVRSSAEFDATALEPRSVELQPGRAAPAKAVRTDADGNGRVDLEFHFWMDATGIDRNTDEVTLRGRTRDGREVVGTADVRLAGRDDDDDEDRDDEDDDEWEEEEERREEKREKAEEQWEEKREEWEDEREGKEEKWEEKKEKWEKKKEKAEEKWEKKREKRERKKEKREEKRDDD